MWATNTYVIIIRNLFIFLFLVSTLVSCDLWENDKHTQKPTHLISKEKMVNIMADMQITEAYLNDLRKSGHKIKDSSLKYYEKIFKKNEITQSEFNENLLYYKQDLVELEEMYTNVITRLNELKAKNEEMILQMKADSIYQDSIKKAKILQDSINHLNDTIFAK